MSLFQTCARRGNEAANKWLSEHPMVLGIIFFVLGAAILGWGIYEIRTGVAHGKRGKQMTGGTAKAMAVVPALSPVRDVSCSACTR